MIYEFRVFDGNTCVSINYFERSPTEAEAARWVGFKSGTRYTCRAVPMDGQSCTPIN